VRFLIDTNVFIPLEPGSASDVEEKSEEAAILASSAIEQGIVLHYHPVQEQDLSKDSNSERRTLRQLLLKKYVVLPKPPSPPAEFWKEVGNPPPGSNSWIDGHLIYATTRNLVDSLISEDRGIHRRCDRLGIADRCLTIADAIAVINDTRVVQPEAPPAVDSHLVHELNERDQIFESLREDYPGFDSWLEKCSREHRKSWTISSGANSGYSGIAIVNPESSTHSSLIGPTLKLCTFKVSDESRGFRFGELLLRTVFEYARATDFNSIFVEAYSKQEALIKMLGEFGFQNLGTKSVQSNELVLGKSLIPSGFDSPELAPLEFHRRYGPFNVCWENVSGFIVPIEPRFHEGLFPELESQRQLLAGVDAFGNTIRKAYLCNSNTTRIEPGDILLFYRSRDAKAITTIGIVEETLRSENPALVKAFTSNRTVYRDETIKEKTEKGGALAIKFFHAPLLVNPILFDSLKDNNVLKSAPQSITKISDSSLKWIKNQTQ